MDLIFLEINPVVFTIAGLLLVLILPQWLATGIYGGIGLSLVLLTFILVAKMQLAAAIAHLLYLALWTFIPGSIVAARGLAGPTGPHWTTRSVAAIWTAGTWVRDYISPVSGIDDEPGPPPEPDHQPPDQPPGYTITPDEDDFGEDDTELPGFDDDVDAIDDFRN